MTAIYRSIFFPKNKGYKMFFMLLQ